MKTLAEKYEKIVKKYEKKFCRKHGFELGYWIGGDVGEMYETADMYFKFHEMKYDIDTEQPENYLLEWYENDLLQTKKVNYKSYCLGLRPAHIIEAERKASLEKSQKDLYKVTEIFNSAMENEVNKAKQ